MVPATRLRQLGPSQVMCWYCGHARLFNVRSVAFIGCESEGCCSNWVATCSPRRNGKRLAASSVRVSSPTGSAEGRRARLHRLVSPSLCLSSLSAFLSVCLPACLSVCLSVLVRARAISAKRAFYIRAVPDPLFDPPRPSQADPKFGSEAPGSFPRESPSLGRGSRGLWGEFRGSSGQTDQTD